MAPRRRLLPILLVATLTPLALLLIGAGVLAYLLFRVEEWQGEIPAVVTSFSTDGERMYVDLVEPAPPDRIRGGFLPDFVAAPPLPGAAVGDRLVCVVRQTFQVNTNIATGPEYEVLSCRPR